LPQRSVPRALLPKNEVIRAEHNDPGLNSDCGFHRLSFNWLNGFGRFLFTAVLDAKNFLSVTLESEKSSKIFTRP
jgi:hypothetical protein